MDQIRHANLAVTVEIRGAASVRTEQARKLRTKLVPLNNTARRNDQADRHAAGSLTASGSSVGFAAVFGIISTAWTTADAAEFHRLLRADLVPLKLTAEGIHHANRCAAFFITAMSRSGGRATIAGLRCAALREREGRVSKKHDGDEKKEECSNSRSVRATRVWLQMIRANVVSVSGVMYSEEGHRCNNLIARSMTRNSQPAGT